MHSDELLSQAEKAVTNSQQLLDESVDADTEANRLAASVDANVSDLIGDADATAETLSGLASSRIDQGEVAASELAAPARQTLVKRIAAMRAEIEALRSD